MVSTVWAQGSVFKRRCTNNDLHLGMTVLEVRDETPLTSCQWKRYTRHQTPVIEDGPKC